MKFLLTIKQGFFYAALILTVVFLRSGVQCYADIPPIANPHVVNLLASITSNPNLNDDPLGDFQSLTIPLKRAGHLFLIEAKIDGQVGNLIFDTGASGLVLNKTYFRKYASDEKPAGGSITGSFDKIARIMIGRIDIYGLYYEKIGADLTDLGHIENRRGVKILGLFGLNMINDFEVIFDANRSELQLNRIDKQGNRIDAATQSIKFDFTQKIETNHNIMLVKGKIGDKMMTFCLDTGAESNVISSNVSKKVMSTITITRRSSMGGASAASVEALYGTMKEFEFGNRQFGYMETVVTSLDAMSEAYGCKIDGMLGYDFWQKGIFCFNFGKNEISFSFAKGESK
jgi:predicted aspartyl protease